MKFFLGLLLGWTIGYLAYPVLDEILSCRDRGDVIVCGRQM